MPIVESKKKALHCDCLAAASDCRLPSSEISTTTTTRVEEQRKKQSIQQQQKSKKQQKPRRRERKVRFIDTVHVRPCLHVNNYTDQEYDDCWYSPEEYRAIKRTDVMPTLKLMSRGNRPSDGDTYTFRGLENRTKTGMLMRRQAKLSGILSVLQEQERQFASQNKKSKQAEEIRVEYMKASKESVKEAHQRGLLDQRNASKRGDGSSSNNSKPKPRRTTTRSSSLPPSQRAIPTTKSTAKKLINGKQRSRTMSLTRKSGYNKRI